MTAVVHVTLPNILLSNIFNVGLILFHIGAGTSLITKCARGSGM